MSDTVFVKADTSVGMPNGAIYHLRANEPWLSDDPVVKQRPDCFVAESPDVRTAGGWIKRTELPTPPAKKRTRK